ncbi:MAG: hypothetical protein SNG27_10125 [Rikenellaceae bacterium]
MDWNLSPITDLNLGRVRERLLCKAYNITIVAINWIISATWAQR